MASIEKNILDLIKNPIFVPIFVSISSDPNPAIAWQNLYKNIYFRFLFIFTLVYQSDLKFRDSIIVTISTMAFFYFISTKKEKKELLKNNHDKKDLKTFVYFSIYCFIIYKLTGRLF